MTFPSNFSILKSSSFHQGDYSIVPIRYDDRFEIMKWRNEQIYHLRQTKPLSKEVQEAYFQNVVSSTFVEEQPNQLLFSYLHCNECIGYGGLVHLNWVDRNAEISFIMATELEENAFSFHWNTFLSLIENVAFKELNFHKIYVYAFDVRPHLYEALVTAGFHKDAVLDEHCFFNNKFLDVVIHSKLNKTLS